MKKNGVTNKQEVNDDFDNQFTKLSEGSKLIATILALFDGDTKLSNLQSIFYSYIQKNSNDSIKAEKFKEYINELEDYFIFVDNVDKDNEVFLEIFKNTPRIICNFKASAYREKIYMILIKTKNTSFALDKFIYSCNILNPLITIIKLFTPPKNADIININKIKLEKIITEKIITDYENMYYSSEYEKYKINLEKIGDNYKVLLLNKVIDIYTLIPNNKLQEFILRQINIILEALYNPNTNFSYNDIFEIPILISKIDIISNSLKESLDIYEIIVKLYNQIYLVDEYMALDSFESIAPKEYTLFKEKYFETIRRYLKQNIINNAIFFEEQDMNEELKYLCDISCDELLNKFHLEKDDYFYEELMEIADYIYEDWLKYINHTNFVINITDD